MPLPRILASDLLIMDHIDSAQTPAVGALVNKYTLKEDDKDIIRKEEMLTDFQPAFKNAELITPGGSASNMLTTMGKLFQDALNIDFIGVTADDDDKEGYGSRIRESLKKANINLLPVHIPVGKVVETTLSYITRFLSGKRNIRTYPGNAGEFINGQTPVHEPVKNNDIILLHGRTLEAG
jgi:hypothetical protein